MPIIGASSTLPTGQLNRRKILSLMPDVSANVPRPMPRLAPPVSRPVSIGAPPAQPSLGLRGIPTDTPGFAPRPTTDLSRAYMDLTPEEQAYQGLMRGGPPEHTGGFWSRVKDALIGGVAGAAASGPEDRGMGFLGGLAGSAISPTFAHTIRHNVIDLPRAQQRAQESRAFADAGLNRRGQFARAYGYDPETGEPTLEGQEQETRQGVLRSQEAQRQAEEQRRQQETLVNIGELYAKYGLAPPANLTQGTALSGITGPPPAKPTTQTPHASYAVDAQGRRYQTLWNAATGSYEPAKDAQGNPIYQSAANKPLDQREIQKQRTTLLGKANARKIAFENAKGQWSAAGAEVNRLQTELNKLEADPAADENRRSRVLTQLDTAMRRADEARAKMDAERDAGQSEFADYGTQDEKGNWLPFFEGGPDHVKVHSEWLKHPDWEQAPQSAAPKSAKDPNIGREVTDGKRKGTIKGIKADGEYDIEWH